MLLYNSKNLKNPMLITSDFFISFENYLEVVDLSVCFCSNFQGAYIRLSLCGAVVSQKLANKIYTKNINSL